MKALYRISLFLCLMAGSFWSSGQNDLVITAIFDGPRTGGLPKGIEIYVINDVPDLSVYGVGSANNGGGTDGVEFVLSGSASAGSFLYVASEATEFTNYFGFGPTFNAGSVMGINGDDAIELFHDVSGTPIVVDTYGDIASTTGSWVYLDGWAYRNNFTGPDGSFNIDNWTYSGANALDICGTTGTNGACSSVIPVGTYIHSEANDETPPTFTSGPTAINITSNGLQVSSQSDEVGTLHYVIDDAGTPTAQEVKDGQLAGGATATFAGSVEVTEATVDVIATIIGLSGATAYDIHVILEDEAGNLSTVSTLTDVTTNATDNTAPQHEDTSTDAFSPHVSNVLAKQFDLTLRLDEIGTAYYVVVADGSSPGITANQVMAGTNAADQPALASGMVNVSSASSNFTVTVGGDLAPATDMDLYVVVLDDETTPNVSTPTFRNVITASDTDAPVLQTVATTAGATSNQIVFTYDENVAASSTAGFYIYINEELDGTPISGFSVVDNTITLTLEATIYANDVITYSYDNNEGNVADLATSPNASVSYTGDVTVNATTVLVDNLADLRSQSTGSTVYYLPSEVVLTYQRSTRNQKYIQDATAGVLIDDSPGTITTVYTTGDGISGLQGTLSSFSGTLQFVPNIDPGTATSNGNAIEPIVVSITDLNASPDTYESRVIQINEVSFVDAGTNFGTGADDYSITDGVNSTVFRDNISQADYSSFLIPYGRLDIIGLGGDFNGTAQIIPFSQTEALFDNYAPQFTVAPAAENISYFSADITFTSDEPGTVYYTFVDDGADAPTISQMLEEAAVRAMTVGANTHSFSELSDNIAYDLYMLAADDEGTPNVQGSLTKVDFTTPELLVDGDSDISATEPAIGSAVISSTATTDTDAVEVFDFIISDAGTADGLSTFVTGISIGKGALNTADWSTTLGGVELQVGEGSVAGVIGADAITFDWSAFPWEITDGGNSTMTLSVWLTESVVDGAVLQFEIPTVHAVTTNGSIGSTIMPTLNAAVTGAAHTIDVEATALEVEVFEAVVIATDFELSVAAVDANGNVDTAARTISLSQTTGTGTLTSVTGLTAQAMTGGVFTWTDLQVDLIGDYTFTVDDDGSALTATTGTVNAFEKVGDLFISEYIEGGSNNKAIEIYNNLGGPADLSRYTVNLYGNGSLTATNTLTLSDIQPSLANGEVLVIANSGSVAAILDVADITSGITFFNGDDALGLLKDDVVIDAFGEIGADPGSAWDVAGVTGATLNKTLVRKNTVTQGNPTNLASFGTNVDDSEWIVYSQDDFNYIGFHVFGEQPFPLITTDENGFTGNFGYVQNGSSSDASSFSVVTEDLSADLVITPPVGFELSADAAFSGTIYTSASPWSIAPVDGVVTQTIHVRFTPTAADGGTYSGDISLESTDATTKTLAVSGVEGAPSAPNLSGIVINEVLPDPNSSSFNYDTDGSGTAADQDEFVEIYNSSEAPVDISGWELRDENGVFFTFPAETVLGAGKYAGIMSLIQTGGSLPTPSEGNLAYAADISNWALTNGGENIALYDPNTNSYIQMKYGPTEADADFSAAWAGAALVGIVEAWGGDIDGTSLVREPAGTATIVIHNSIQGAENASFAEPTIDPNAPQISVSDEDGIHFGNLSISVTSEVQTYTVSGINLAGDIVITAPAGFEVSTDGSNFSSSVNLTPTANEVAETTISVRFTAASFGSKDGEITHTSTDAFQIDLDVTGAGVDETTIAFISFANCDAEVFSSVSVTGAQEWRCAFTGETGNGYLMSGFASGAQDNEDWLVGSFDLTSYAGAEFSFDNEMQFGGPALEVYASTDYAGNPAAATWTQLAAVVDENTSSNTWVNSGDISLVEYVGGTVYIGFKYTSNTTDAPQWIIDNVLITELSASFVVNADNFNGAFGNVNLGSTSANSSFIIDAFALSGASVTVTPPAEFEVSLTSTFDAIGTNASPLTITVGNGGIVDNAEVFVRFAPSTTGAASGNVEIATDGYSTEILAVSGTGMGFLNVNSTSFNGDFGLQDEGTISVSTSFLVNAAGLTGDVTVTPPVGYEVSLSSTFATISTNASPLTISATNNAVSNVTVYVRFTPSTFGTFNGNITVSSTGYTNVTLAVSGTGNEVLSIAQELGIYIYPNPTADMIMVNNTSNRVISMELYSIEGARMPLVGKGTNYDLSALNSGLYILVIKDENGHQLGSERIMKK